MKRQYFLAGFLLLFLQSCNVSPRQISEGLTLLSYEGLLFMLVLLIPAYFVGKSPKMSKKTTLGEILAGLCAIFATLTLFGLVIGSLLMIIDDLSRGFLGLAILKLIAVVGGVMAYLNIMNKWSNRKKYIAPKSQKTYDSLIVDDND